MWCNTTYIYLASIICALSVKYLVKCSLMRVCCYLIPVYSYAVWTLYKNNNTLIRTKFSAHTHTHTHAEANKKKRSRGSRTASWHLMRENQFVLVVGSLFSRRWESAPSHGLKKIATTHICVWHVDCGYMVYIYVMQAHRNGLATYTYINM